MTTYVLAPTIRFGLAGTVNYTVNYYDSGGLVAATTWSDAGTTANSATMTVAADGTAGGGTGGGIYIQAGKAYRAIYKNGSGATVFDVDPILVADPTGNVGTAGTSLTLTGNLTAVDGTFSGDVTVGDDLTVSGDTTITGYLIADGIKLTSLPPGFRNGTIDATAAANAITFTYETPASATPSATDPVSVSRRSATITNGSMTTVNQTGAVSLPLPSGATLGCANSEAVRIHLGLIRNAGSALEIACWTAAVGTSTGIKTFTPVELISTTAIGAGSDSAQTMYSTTARTSQPMVYIGYIEATSGATAGQWASVDKIVNWEPGVPIPGDVVQVVSTYTGAVATGTTILPGDDTIPQITEGDQYMSVAITPKSLMNWLRRSAQAHLYHNVAASSAHTALFQVGTSDALRAGTSAAGSASHNPSILDDFRKAGSDAAITTTFRAGPAAAGTVTFNGNAGARVFGGVDNSYIIIQEIHA